MKKQKRKWAYFAMPNGKQVMSAKVDGYNIGDRLLEDVFFIITIQPDGSLKAETQEDAKPYMSNLNEKKWLKEAVKYAETNDIFYGVLNEEDEYLLFDTDGKQSCDTSASAPKIIPKAIPVSIIATRGVGFLNMNPKKDEGNEKIN